MMKCNVTTREAARVGRALGVRFRKFSPATLARGMTVELEHRNVTHGDPKKTAQIALAHLKERPDYYSKLAIFDKDARCLPRKNPRGYTPRTMATKTRLTADEIAALHRFASKHGVRWKHKLMVLWSTGRDADSPDGPHLRSVRNKLGPVGLRALRTSSANPGTAMALRRTRRVKRTRRRNPGPYAAGPGRYSFDTGNVFKYAGLTRHKAGKLMEKRAYAEKHGLPLPKPPRGHTWSDVAAVLRFGGTAAKRRRKSKKACACPTPRRRKSVRRVSTRRRVTRRSRSLPEPRGPVDQFDLTHDVYGRP